MYERLIRLNVLVMERSWCTWCQLKPIEACLSDKAERYESSVVGLMDLCMTAIYSKRCLDEIGQIDLSGLSHSLDNAKF